MVKVKKDLTGMRFGRLTVIRQVEDYIEPKSQIHHARWLCVCSCSEHKQIIVNGKDLKRKNGTRSCGCLNREKTIERNKKYNNYKLNLQDEYGLYGIGYCSNSDNIFYFDMDDYDKIKDYCWREHILQGGYHALEARVPNERSPMRMHWLIVGKYYDHADRNSMNNRKYNLRQATRQENNRNHTKQKNNTSGYTGITWHKSNKVWDATIVINKKKIYLGSSTNKEKAITLRLQAEKKYFGEFAPQRHLFEQYGIER